MALFTIMYDNDATYAEKRPKAAFLGMFFAWFRKGAFHKRGNSY
jgi:hypothetical protein